MLNEKLKTCILSQTLYSQQLLLVLKRSLCMCMCIVNLAIYLQISDVPRSTHRSTPDHPNEIATAIVYRLSAIPLRGSGSVRIRIKICEDQGSIGARMSEEIARTHTCVLHLASVQCSRRYRRCRRRPRRRCRCRWPSKCAS